jgi:hypothetical protein
LSLAARRTVATTLGAYRCKKFFDLARYFGVLGLADTKDDVSRGARTLWLDSNVRHKLAQTVSALAQFFRKVPSLRLNFQVCLPSGGYHGAFHKANVTHSTNCVDMSVQIQFDRTIRSSIILLWCGHKGKAYETQPGCDAKLEKRT